MPKSDWAFADCSSTPFPGKPDLNQAVLKGRLQSGAGLHARFHRQESESLRYRALLPPAIWSLSCVMTQAAANRVAGKVRLGDRAAAYRSRATILRSLIHLGFNHCGDGRMSFDGLIHRRPRMLSMNHRFATPGGLVGLTSLAVRAPTGGTAITTWRGAGPS